MHTVFHVIDIKQAADDSHRWEVDLSITDENGPQLATLIESIRKQTACTGWYQMSQLLFRLGHFQQAEGIYSEMLTKASNDFHRAHLYYHIRVIKCNQGAYQEPAALYERSDKIFRILLSRNHPDLAVFYNNIDQMYTELGDYLKSLKLYKKSVKISKISLSQNHPNLAYCYDNMGQLYCYMGDHCKELEFYEKAQKIRQAFRRSNHPDLAQSYNNIGDMYYKMGDYLRALEAHEKSLKIYKTISASKSSPFSYCLRQYRYCASRNG
ncbi:unnamed protein product [Rotaria magnacalcarata]|nr:unnamed protein product [Rotaria magnacalcarata]